MKDFQGKVAVVTGAASGIGRAMTLDFARRGMKVVAADIEAEPLKETQGLVEQEGAECLSVITDVADHGSVEALAETTYAKFGAAHVVCNNAGVAPGGPLADATHQDWEWAMGVNVWGVIHGVMAFAPRMIAGGQGGHVVNTGSMAGLIAGAGLGVYNTTKYAVVGLSETLGRELKEHGIGVSVLCPMGVTTRIRDSARNRPEALQSAMADYDPPELMGEYLSAETVSGMVMRAIETGEIYVLTHPESEEFVTRRFDRIRKAYAHLKQ